MLKPVFQSNLGCGFAVAAFVVLTYDWGEHDNIKELLTAYMYFQHLHSDRRYENIITRAAISLRMVFIGRISLGE
jgi:hypothetical protein